MCGGQEVADWPHTGGPTAGLGDVGRGKLSSIIPGAVTAEFAKLGIVAEEIDESVYWLELMLRTNLGDPSAVGRLLPEAKELRAIFAASYRTARRGKKRAGR